MEQTSTARLDSSISIGRRIAEIMKEKGKAFTQQAVANKIGISRETLRLMLSGKREILPFELKKIAVILKLPIERIQQEDFLRVEKELRVIIDSVSEIDNGERALHLAEQLIEIAVGITERCISLNYLGRVLYYIHDFQRAHDTWMTAHKHANDIYIHFKESELLFDVTKNLMISYAARKEFEELSNFIKDIEPLFHVQPERSGALCYSYAMIEYQKGNKDLAKRWFYQSLECYTLSKNEKNIGVAERNVGYIEYVLSNYEQSKMYFELALSKVDFDEYWYLTTIKDYCKTLIKLEEFERANELISISLKKAQCKGFNGVVGKIQRIHADIYLVMKDLNNACQVLKCAIGIFMESEMLKELRESVQVLCKCLNEQERYTEAFAEMEEYERYLAGKLSARGIDLLSEE